MWKVLASILGPVEPDAMSPTARHRCDISSDLLLAYLFDKKSGVRRINSICLFLHFSFRVLFFIFFCIHILTDSSSFFPPLV